MTIWDWIDKHWLVAFGLAAFACFWLGILAMAAIARLLAPVGRERPVTISFEGTTEAEPDESKGRPS